MIDVTLENQSYIKLSIIFCWLPLFVCHDGNSSVTLIFPLSTAVHAPPSIPNTLYSPLVLLQA